MQRSMCLEAGRGPGGSSQIHRGKCLLGGERRMCPEGGQWRLSSVIRASSSDQSCPVVPKVCVGRACIARLVVEPFPLGLASWHSRELGTSHQIALIIGLSSLGVCLGTRPTYGQEVEMQAPDKQIKYLHSFQAAVEVSWG